MGEKINTLAELEEHYKKKKQEIQIKQRALLLASQKRAAHLHYIVGGFIINELSKSDLKKALCVKILNSKNISDRDKETLRELIGMNADFNNVKHKSNVKNIKKKLRSKKLLLKRKR